MLDSPAYYHPPPTSIRSRQAEQQLGNTERPSSPFNGWKTQTTSYAVPSRQPAHNALQLSAADQSTVERFRMRGGTDIEPALRMINYESSSIYSQSVGGHRNGDGSSETHAASASTHAGHGATTSTTTYQPSTSSHSHAHTNSRSKTHDPDRTANHSGQSNARHGRGWRKPVPRYEPSPPSSPPVAAVSVPAPVQEAPSRPFRKAPPRLNEDNYVDNHTAYHSRGHYAAQHERNATETTSAREAQPTRVWHPQQTNTDDNQRSRAAYQRQGTNDSTAGALSQGRIVNEARHERSTEDSNQNIRPQPTKSRKAPPPAAAVSDDPQPNPYSSTQAPVATTFAEEAPVTSTRATGNAPSHNVAIQGSSRDFRSVDAAGPSRVDSPRPRENVNFAQPAEVPIAVASRETVDKPATVTRRQTLLIPLPDITNQPEYRSTSRKQPEVRVEEPAVLPNLQQHHPQREEPIPIPPPRARSPSPPRPVRDVRDMDIQPQVSFLNLTDAYSLLTIFAQSSSRKRQPVERPSSPPPPAKDDLNLPVSLPSIVLGVVQLKFNVPFTADQRAFARAVAEANASCR